MKPVHLTSDYINDGNLAADEQLGVGKYYIIEEDVNIQKERITFPADSVLDFRGGSFMQYFVMEQSTGSIVPPIVQPIAKTPVVDLNGSTVYAPIYCIFYSSIEVEGFANSLIHADWFNDISSTQGEEVYINRAIVAAKGCPVTLEHRTYTLKGSITFPVLPWRPDLDELYGRQTLIAPGMLDLDIPTMGSESFPAIVINTNYINLDIARISGKHFNNASGEVVRKGTGIAFTGGAAHCDINVGCMTSVAKGFDISPTVYVAPNHRQDAGIQYCRIKFQYIKATYGFYIDIYSGKDKTIATEGSNTPIYSTWFNENRILGGELSGINGIYFVDLPEGYAYAPLDGLVFENIGFEDLDGTPLKINNVSDCRFMHMRFMEKVSLPTDRPWIVLRNICTTDIWIKGKLNPDLIRVDEDNNPKNPTRGVIIKSWLEDDKWGWHARFDSMAVMPLPDRDQQGQVQPVLTACSSISPFNMTKTIVVDGQKEDNGTGIEGIDLEKATYYIRDILPVRDESVHNDQVDWDTTFNVLPRTLNVIMGDTGELMILNVSGLQNFAPSILDIYLYAPGAKMLVIKTDDQNVSFTDASYPPPYKKASQIVCNETGLYRLTWDSDWNIVVTKIVS